MAPATDTNYCLKTSGSNNITSYNGNSQSFVLKITNTNVTYAVTESISPTISITDGITIQTITSSNCPTIRTRAVDARDSHAYWVQKLADGKCWMLTNLAYAGGGTNTYNDIRTLTNGTSDTSITYTVSKYYIIPSTTNYTTEPTNPSTSTDGTGQYGYLYNFCGANGGQTGNGACDSASSTAVNTAISVCPAGWRLPVGNIGGEFDALNVVVNSGLTGTDAGLRTGWLGQRSGVWSAGFAYQVSNGTYWSYVQYSASNAYVLNFNGSSVNIAAVIYSKGAGYGVRCVAV